ncbi:MDR family MFS transporter [Nocardia stercoris]|uniref:DHA2 family efflux MFS transporter permease subunit n=1 Tax=Nocardia stercoris TaxID=2483361 RepID=A0A3M2L4J7_9NOCA|nr:MDR family MFS transporter [Nocardia stercoris]RMI32567.1 DHA2 family efflux MFS transporter permease subunit [Nocardia stercoris]
MTVATSNDAPVQVSRARANVVFVTIVLGMLMAALDQTIVSTALPTIVADLGGSGRMSWVVTSYLLAEAVATALAGKFGDLFGRKVVFQISGLVFITGSAVAGISNGMAMLVAARAVQGVGAGGLMVTAMALIADVIPLRDRGRYQGAMGAVFGVTTVIGPTLGGLFTDHASWRWCFYVNVPIAILMVFVAQRTIPRIRAAAKPVVDYAGIAVIAAGVSCLILALEWGGHQYAWGSPVIIGLFVAAVILIAVFVFVESRAREPMLPLRLFRRNVFTVCSILSFIVGFAMLGAMTYLPTYLQFVDGVSATQSGFRTLPLVAGLMFTSILSGQIVGRTGRYKIFPILGTAVMAVALWLMSTMGRDTGTLRESLYMAVMGLGIGLAMQVLTIAVQNTVPYSDLGTATSGVTFFRTLGSTFGTAIFGTLFANRIGPNLRDALAKVPEVPPAVAQSPQLLRKLPLAQALPIIDAYAEAINYVFEWVIPVAVLGFVVSWFLKEVPLRGAARAEAPEMGNGFAAPDSPDREVLLEHSIACLLGKLRAKEIPGPDILTEVDSELGPDQAWALAQVRLLQRFRGGATLAAIAAPRRMPPQVLQPVYDRAHRYGYIEWDGDKVRLTPTGQAEFDRVAAGWRNWVGSQIAEWDGEDPRDRVQLEHAMDNVAMRLLDEFEGAAAFAE